MTLKTHSLDTEAQALKHLLKHADMDHALRQRIEMRAVDLVTRIREDSAPGMMELFLGEYGLSSDEGIALMCLAEALLRVPDDETIDALIEDKIAPSAWGQHLGESHSPLVNASTWALFVTGKVLKEDNSNPIASVLHSAIKRLGEPIIRQAVSRAMKEMGRQFVLGETIEGAMARGRGMEEKGYTYSYDMLGEAALTDRDARHYHLAYGDAIGALAKSVKSDDIRQNPGISIKLSALHPRYETMQKKRVMEELVPRARSLAVLAKSAGIGLNIDAEEAGRLELSLDVIEAIVSDPAFAGWDGFGVVVQGYNPYASAVLDWLYELASHLDRRFMVRLVKGAYWDTEIKLAQVEGHGRFPVFTQKPSTDVSYICCAQKLLAMSDRIYPQFATHNAHTVAAIVEMAGDKETFEFQRLHGMGEALHDTVLRRHGTRCRIYAPVGAHKDLLAYLVRRLLENGANSSFVNQIVDETVSPQEVATDPITAVEAYLDAAENPAISQPCDLFMPGRTNSKGWDLSDPQTLGELETGIARFDNKTWEYKSSTGEQVHVKNPATGGPVGSTRFASEKDVVAVSERMQDWSHKSPAERAVVLRRAADLYEQNAHEIFALLIREAGKTLPDCIGELREAVDFLRYYADQSQSLQGEPVGIFTCIAPWNFPLAIFTGQIAAALAAGNGVLAKPAESTGLIACFAIDLFWQAGVPKDALQLISGLGSEVGAALTSNKNVGGVCFTGSTATAQLINRTMAENLSPSAPLIAETGGINAMIIDSTALPEQAISDVLASAFQSAGQRCSALRMLYLQSDIAESFQEMLFAAMEELKVGDPRDFSTDVGPIINVSAANKIHSHIGVAHDQGWVLKQTVAPDNPIFVPPTALRVNGIEDIEEEVFGPVLHIATYESGELDAVIDAVNGTGFGLTFGLHSRIDDRVQHIIDRVEAGNIYINRNQIGAVVGSQPFGGEGLSGTGPKAGGPQYLKRFVRSQSVLSPPVEGNFVNLETIEKAFDENARSAGAQTSHVGKSIEMPGPTGESNRYSTIPRGNVLCLGPTKEMAEEQARQAREIGCNAVAVAPGVEAGVDGVLQTKVLTEISNLDAVVSWSTETVAIRQALAQRPGAIVPLLSGQDFAQWLAAERHVCIDTTAAGGNAALLAG